MSNRVIIRNGVMYQWVPNTVGWAQAREPETTKSNASTWIGLAGIAGVLGIAYMMLRKRR